MRKLSLYGHSGSAAPAFLRTAFLSPTGNDGTAVLGEPGQPFETWAAVFAALNGAHPGQDTTIILLGDITDDHDGSGDADAVFASGVTIQSDSGTVREVSGGFVVGGNPCLITLSKTNFALVTSDGAEISLQLTGDGASSVIIDELNVDGDDRSADSGGQGSFGDSGVGSPNYSPVDPRPDDNSPPTPGAHGGDYESVGQIGETGPAGGHASGVTLLGTGTITLLNGRGGAAGSGGKGGTGGTATGGGGQNGGNSNSGGEEDGAPGGDGGDATSRGGKGGTGGTGGNGSTVQNTGGWTITAHDLSGGAAGSPGDPGDPGTAMAGSGGTGGNAAPSGGSAGASGASGSAFTPSGDGGDPGSAGSDGGII